MANYNRVILAGNLTRDPELRQTGSGISVANFGIAVNRVRSKNEEVDFFDITAWRELGETIANYKKKGDPILVEGKLQYQTYKDRDGNNRSKIIVVADNVQFLGRASDSNNNGGGNRSTQRNRQNVPQQPDPDNFEDFDDIPF